MSNVDRWINRFVMERLSALDSINSMEPGFEEEHGCHVKLKELILNDGRGLNFDDSALSLFCRFADPSGNQDIKNLSRLLRDPWILFHSSNEPNEDVAQLDLVDQIFALRKEGGWGEMDRLIKHLFGTTLSDFADLVSSHAHFDATDSGLGGGRFYKIEFMSAWEIPHVIFGSTAASAIGMLPEVFGQIKSRLPEMNKPPRAIRLFCHGYEYFNLPLHEVLVDVESFSTSGSRFKTSLEINWDDMTIGRKEHGVMLSLLKLAPASVHNRIKRQYLEEGLGL
jgi:hypothetical protein